MWKNMNMALLHWKRFNMKVVGKETPGVDLAVRKANVDQRPNPQDHVVRDPE